MAAELTASRKAARLIVDGRVRPAGAATVYEVDGDHGRYRVVLGDGWTSCSCPALREMCSHVESCLLYDAALAEGVEAALRSAEQDAASERAFQYERAEGLLPDADEPRP